MINILGVALENIMYKGYKGYFFLYSTIGIRTLEIRQGTYFIIYVKTALVKSKCPQGIFLLLICGVGANTTADGKQFAFIALLFSGSTKDVKNHFRALLLAQVCSK